MTTERSPDPFSPPYGPAMPPAPGADRPGDARAPSSITRREAIQRVTALLGGIALVGGPGLLTGCRDDRRPAVDDVIVEFTAEQIAFLDEIAETILPETHTPGARAAETGVFMALMVRDVYHPEDQQLFLDGMERVEQECERMHRVGFMQATPEQRLALLERLDREAKEHMDSRDRARRERDAAEADAYLPDQRQEGAVEGDAGAAAAITADTPAHYFRMMKELALLGYFTSEIGYTQAMRWLETPGRYEPCAPYTAGETIWASHP
jgi:hypothetical protein